MLKLWQMLKWNSGTKYGLFNKRCWKQLDACIGGEFNLDSYLIPYTKIRSNIDLEYEKQNNKNFFKKYYRHDLRVDDKFLNRMKKQQITSPGQVGQLIRAYPDMARLWVQTLVRANTRTNQNV